MAQPSPLRLGACLGTGFDHLDGWARAVTAAGYSATDCPLGADADDADVLELVALARRLDVRIAEVGAWSNPLARDEEDRRRAVAHCQRQLELADRVGAACCVNIAGSLGATWDGPSAENLTPATFALIVDTVREIVDAVRPRRTCYTLETMPWMYPDSAESYAALLDAVDRPGVAVHFDPVNLLSSPQRYFGNAELIRDFIRRLGPHIRSVHVKDVLLAGHLTVHLEEVRPGLGVVDHGVLLTELSALGGEVPLIIEHLGSADEYAAAATHLRHVAAAVRVDILAPAGGAASAR